MTSETSFREKGRAVFLAALMVLSVFAMSAAFAGGTAADGHDDPVAFDLTDEDSLSNADIWIGQELEVDGNFDEPVQLKAGIQGDEDAETLATLRPDGDIVTVETDGLEDGEPYHLEYTGDLDDAVDEDDLGTFWANEHNIDADFDVDIVNQDVATLEIEDEDRDEIAVYVSGELENETLAEDELGEIFGVDEDELEDEILIDELDQELNEIHADFFEQNTGDYEFTVEVTDTTASDTAEITVGEDVDADAQFNESTYEQNIGDVAEFTVEPTATDEMYVELVEDEDYYNATLEISDYDDADEVTVEFNSYDAGDVEKGDVNDVFSSEDADVEVIDEDIDSAINGDHLLESDFELEVYTEDPTEYDVDETDAAILLLTERSTGDMNTWALPGDEFDADDVDLEDIEESATDRDYVADEDVLVVGVEASGIYGYAFNESGEWNDESDLELEFEDTDEPRYGSADSFTADELDSDNFVVDEDENRFYVVVDATENEMDADETWNATFTVDEDNPYVDEDESTDTQFDVEETSLELIGDHDDEDRLEVENSNESELTAETNLAPGTEGDFRLRATSDIYTADAEVDGDGMLTTSFDLSQHEAGEEIRSIRADAGSGDNEHDVEGVFTASDAEDAVSIDADAPSDVYVDDDASLDVTVSNGGEENATTNYTVTIDGEEVDSDDLDLEAGDSISESYDFDTAAEGDIDWSVETDDADASGTLSVSADDANGDDANGDDANGDDANGDDPNGVDDEPNGADDHSDDTGADDDESTPGFGVAVAIVALLAAAMLAIRRDN